ncbi:MAG: BlaI/MecI/CopY family transcriptional regulator [Pirellulales bacterium]
MPERPQATDAELAILKLLWEGGPLTARSIREQLYPAGTPSDHATVQKLLQRLEQKEFVARDRSEFAHSFAATVTREELAGNQLEALAEKLTDGSLVPFILHAVSAKRLTSEERNEIRRLLDRRK